MEPLNIPPDVTSYEYLVKNFCMFGQTEKASQYLKEMKQKYVHLIIQKTKLMKNKITRNIDSGPVYVALAAAYALKGEKKNSLWAIKKARKTQKNESGSSERASVPLFLKLQNEEVERDCKQIETYLKSGNDFTSYSFQETPNLIILNQSTQKLAFETIFGNKNPVKLEIGSGHGDWIVGKAKKFPNENWVAIEVRYERCYQTWSKMIFNQVSNLVILVKCVLFFFSLNRLIL